MADGLGVEGWDLDAFDEALAYGEGRQEAFASILFRTRVEVKSDKAAARTGKVFVEIGQGKTVKRASGINTTQADFYAIELVGLCWVIIETPRLKAITRQARERFGTQTGGDNGNIGVLVPVEWLVRPWRAA